jgi:hypothetical protein
MKTFGHGRLGSARCGAVWVGLVRQAGRGWARLGLVQLGNAGLGEARS